MPSVLAVLRLMTSHTRAACARPVARAPRAAILPQRRRANLPAEIMPSSQTQVGLALQCLDFKWKQRIKVTGPHEMIDIESISGPNRDFRRRERKGEIPCCG
jgi:hypothetical protein